MRNYTDWIGKWAGYTPDKIAIRELDSGNTATYGSLNSIADRIALYLTQKLELNTGDRIAVLAEFSIDYFCLFAAAQKTGITLVPLNYRLTSEELNIILIKSNPRLIVIDDNMHDLASNAATYKKIPYKWLMSDLREFQLKKEDPIIWPEVDSETPLFIIFTSGTTGEPKGAIYTHKMAFWNSINTSLRLNITAEDHTVNCMPSFHTGGWNVLITPFLHHGASVTLLNKFDANQVLTALENSKSTLFMGVPTMLKMMADSVLFEKTNLSRLRYMIVGGEAMPIPLIEQYKTKGVLIRQGYGLTEAGPNITSLAEEFVISKKGSIGVPNFYIETKIKYEDSDNPNIGELLIKGPVVTPGYWNDTEATAKAIQQGWFHTGDIVERDKDGFLYIIDRIKNMYISGGENVYPLEVEKALRNNLKIAEAAIIGIPDQKWGEVGKAFVVVKKGKSITREELIAFLTEKIARYKIPKQFVFVNDLPKNDTGKIDRRALNNL